MVQQAEFSMEDISIPLLDLRAQVSITFGWWDQSVGYELVAPISGFPRAFTPEPVEKGTAYLSNRACCESSR